VSLAASYIRTESEGGLPTADEQMATIVAYAAENGHDLVAHYKDLDAPGHLLYHRPGLKQAINNIKELEDWRCSWSQNQGVSPTLIRPCMSSCTSSPCTGTVWSPLHARGRACSPT
jgi:hypothetical protein